MSTEELTRETVHIRAENIGGIERTDIAVSPGVVALTGRNATNRTSLFHAVMAALGSDTVSLKGDADEGHIELTIGDRTYTRTPLAKTGTVTTNGDPYLDDATVADCSRSSSNPTILNSSTCTKRRTSSNSNSAGSKATARTSTTRSLRSKTGSQNATTSKTSAPGFRLNSKTSARGSSASKPKRSRSSTTTWRRF